jgi:hypothetical protein
MPTAGAVASELRRIADALDKEPGAEIEKVSLYFSHLSHKDKFLTLARLLPRPLLKSYTSNNDNEGDLELRYDSAALSLNAYINRSAVCTVVEPAKPAVYKCEPLLSDAEEAAVTQV